MNLCAMPASTDLFTTRETQGVSPRTDRKKRQMIWRFFISVWHSKGLHMRPDFSTMVAGTVAMSESKVYVIWSNPLFQEVIRLLLSDSALKVVGSSSDHALAKDEIQSLSPHIVIVETTDSETRADEETISLLQSGSRVIRLSLADNDLSIYRRERHTVEDIDDLIGVMMNGYDESPTGDEAS